MTTAVVAGSTGLVGTHLLTQLSKTERYDSITALTRRELDPDGLPPRVEQKLLDFDQLHAAEISCDHVFCALGTTIKKAGSRERFRMVDFEYPLALARVTASGGASHFSLVSSQGASPQSRIFYSRVKGEVEAAISDVGFASLVILRPSIIGGDRQESRTLERIGQFLLQFAPKSYRTIPAAVIARAAVTMAAAEPPGQTVLESRDIWTANKG